MATLRAAGHEAVAAASGEAALAVDLARIDAVILDVGLPDIDGFEVLNRWRRGGSMAPVVMLTARDAVRDRIAGLDIGADDYVLKPFDPDELVARLRAVVRRKAGLATTVTTVGVLRCDWDAGEIRVGDRTLELRPRERTALMVLASRAGRVVDRALLEAELFPDEAVAPNVLDVHIGRLRRKLAPDGPRIHTLRGLGYRLDP